jgi:UrcA family protein
MNSRKSATIVAAAIVGLGLSFSATHAFAQPPRGDVIVKGHRVDPATQRTVSYKDLNLAFTGGQRVLNSRIWRTAGALCQDLNGDFQLDSCTDSAIHSTDDQVAAAVERAQMIMAGKAVGPAIAISMVASGR